MSGQDTGLNNGTTYYYVLRAYNASSETANSQQVSATPAPVAPPAPAGLKGWGKPWILGGAVLKLPLGAPCLPSCRPRLGARHNEETECL